MGFFMYTPCVGESLSFGLFKKKTESYKVFLTFKVYMGFIFIIRHTENHGQRETHIHP